MLPPFTSQNQKFVFTRKQPHSLMVKTTTRTIFLLEKRANATSTGQKPGRQFFLVKKKQADFTGKGRKRFLVKRVSQYEPLVGADTEES